MISVKCRDGYPKTEGGIRNKFKDFLLDISYASECYPACEIAKQKVQGTTNKVCSSLIFWIDRNRDDGKENESVVDKIGNFNLREECHYDIVRGWINYFKIGSIKLFLEKFGQWLRHKIRCIIIKQWKIPMTIYRNLKVLNIKYK